MSPVAGTVAGAEEDRVPSGGRTTSPTPTGQMPAVARSSAVRAASFGPTTSQSRPARDLRRRFLSCRSPIMRFGYKLLCCNSFITVVESAELGNCNDLSVAQGKCQDSEGLGGGGGSRFSILKCQRGAAAPASLPVSRTPKPESAYRTRLRDIPLRGMPAQIQRADRDSIQLLQLPTDIVFEIVLCRLRYKLDLSPFLRQTVKTQNPLNGELSHGIVS